MKKNLVIRSIKLSQLVVCGAIIGLYAARSFGWIGLDITPAVETTGASIGAVGVLGLKLLHLV